MRRVALLAVLLLPAIGGCAFGISEPAKYITSSSARLDGDLISSRASGGEITYWFKYGTTTEYGSQSQGGSVPVGTPNSAFGIPTTISDLAAGTTYHFRLCARDPDNASNPGCSIDRSFTTAPGPGPFLTLTPDCAEPFGRPTDAVQMTGTGLPGMTYLGFEISVNNGPFTVPGGARTNDAGEVAFHTGPAPRGTLDRVEMRAFPDADEDSERDPGESIIVSGSITAPCPA